MTQQIHDHETGVWYSPIHSKWQLGEDFYMDTILLLLFEVQRPPENNRHSGLSS